MARLSDEDTKKATEIANRLNDAIDKPSIFAEVFFNHEVFDYNKNYVDSKERFICYRAGGKVGKTTSTAVKVLHGGFLAPLVHPMVKNKCEMIIVAPTQSQANIMLSTIKSLLHSSKILEKYIIRETAFQIDLSFLPPLNGMTSIYTRAAGERGDSLRGYIPHYIIFDEAAFIKRPIFDAMLPRGMATQARVWMISTPFGKSGVFFETCIEARCHDPIKFPTSANNPSGVFMEYRARSMDNPYIKNDPAYMQLIKNYTRDQYIQEVEGEFLEEGGSLIPLDQIRRAFKDYTMPREPRYFLGVDISRSGVDDTVYTLICTDEDREKVYVVDIEVERQRGDLTIVADRVEQWFNAYPIETAFLDETGLGAGVVDMCRKKELRIRPVTFSLKEKAEMYKNLRMIFENDRISMKFNEMTRRLGHQLQYLTKDYSANNIMKIESEEHDDFPSSLALACKAVDKGDAFGYLDGAEGILF